MKKYLSNLSAIVLTLSLLFLSGNLIHITFNHSMAAMTSSQCQVSCSSSQTPADTATKPDDILKDKEKEPQPNEPYYLAFMGVGWTTLITVASAYLFRYLYWRPPDLYKLNVAYRF